MPLTEWYLNIRETDRDWTKIEVDPAMIAGLKGTFGQALFFPYIVSDNEKGRVTLRLLSLEGWIGWSGENEFAARLRIPSQVVRADGRPLGLHIPITDAQIEAIEEGRKGGQIILTISLNGLAIVIPRVSSSVEAPSNTRDSAPAQSGLMLTPVQSAMTVSLVIERERWLTILQQLGAGTRRLVELPEPRLPRGEQHWAECVRLLDEATRLYRSGDYEQALKNCRSVVEGIPNVLCAIWGLPEKPRRQSIAQWIEALEGQLRTAWQTDVLTPGMLRTMVTGAWQWLAPAPHYGTGIPLREDVAFALGLCTDLLSFAAQVLRAHPDPI